MGTGANRRRRGWAGTAMAQDALRPGRIPGATTRDALCSANASLCSHVIIALFVFWRNPRQTVPFHALRTCAKLLGWNIGFRPSMLDSIRHFGILAASFSIIFLAHATSPTQHALPEDRGIPAARR